MQARRHGKRNCRAHVVEAILRNNCHDARAGFEVKGLEFPTLDKAEVQRKTVLVRVDINSPIDPKTGEILDDTRIRMCAPTIKELAEKGAKVVVLAHQGRPGDEDFTTLEEHSKKLSAAIGLDVKYVQDIFGPTAKFAI
ncbi:MAG: phosphoglycerate kinase, partial [Hadesarchaea archaeon]|nr:phosphoglycerate kinase [Hadesarchaea archaeon]